MDLFLVEDFFFKDLDLEDFEEAFSFKECTDLEFLPSDFLVGFVDSTVLKWFIDLDFCIVDLRLIGVTDCLSFLVNYLWDKYWKVEFEQAPPPTPVDL